MTLSLFLLPKLTIFELILQRSRFFLSKIIEVVVMERKTGNGVAKVHPGIHNNSLVRPTGSRGFTFLTTKRRNQQPLRDYQRMARYCRRSAERRMLKHVSVSPWRGRADSVSLASSSASSCGSGSPTPAHTPPPSRASSCASLAPLNALSSFSPGDNNPQQTTIKVYANCLRPDIEYKTLSISYETTCREVVQNLLNKYKMRHRDPRLFYLTMEVTVRRANVRTVLPLDEDARPAVLQSCHPPGDSRFSLQTRRGGLVRIYDSALMSESKYKCLLISEHTTVDELIQMLLSCYSSSERVEEFSLYEVCKGEEYQRKLHPDDSPLKVTQRWTSADRHLRIRRNPDYNPHRRKNMWASDSSITMAMSKLQLHSNLQSHHHQHHHHHLQQNNNNNNNNNNKNHIHRHHHHQSNNNKSHVQMLPVPTSRIVVPHVSQMTQSVPSTPLTGKHVSSTSSYADYENYFYI